jgi:hypothetical protein
LKIVARRFRNVLNCNYNSSIVFPFLSSFFDLSFECENKKNKKLDINSIIIVIHLFICHYNKKLKFTMNDSPNESNDDDTNNDVVPSSSSLLGLFNPPLEDATTTTSSNNNDGTPKKGVIDPSSSGMISTPEAERPSIVSTSSPGDRNDPNMLSSPGSLSHMMRLFAPAQTTATAAAAAATTTTILERPRLGERQSTVPRSNRSSSSQQQQQQQQHPMNLSTSESTPLLGDGLHTPQSSVDWRDATTTPVSTMMQEATPKAGYNRIGGGAGGSHTPLLSSSHVKNPSVAMPAITEDRVVQNLALPQLDSNGVIVDRSNITTTTNNQRRRPNRFIINHYWQYATSNVLGALKMPTTYIGSFMYLLYHVVFSLALGSAIMRPNSPTPILGLMTKTAALGTVVASPIYWFDLSSQVPALYPTAGT